MPIDYRELHTGDYPDAAKFDDKGDQLIGDVTNAKIEPIERTKEIRGEKVTKMVDTPIYEVVQDDGTVVSLIAGAVELKRLVKEHEIQEGDRIKVTMTGRDGNKKLWDVRVNKGGAKVTGRPDLSESADGDDDGYEDWATGGAPPEADVF